MLGFPGGSVVEYPPANAGDAGSILGSGRFPWRRAWQPTPVFLPGEFQGQRSLAGYSPWGCKESDMTERLGMNKSLKIFKPQFPYLYGLENNTHARPLIQQLNKIHSYGNVLNVQYI